MLKATLRKWPFLYRLLQNAYYGFRCVAEKHILGTIVQEWIWRRERREDNANSPQKYLESSQHPHRLVLMEKILSHSPLKKVLEIGCNAGPNLLLLSGRCKEADLHGIDINTKAVEEGRKHLKGMGISNVFLDAGKADSLERFGDRSMDIVFSDATLMYIGPDKIQDIVGHMVRIARKAVILNEWDMGGSSETDHRYHYGHWIHNYLSLFEKCGVRGKIEVTRISREMWDDSNWVKYGAMIEARLS